MAFCHRCKNKTICFVFEKIISYYRRDYLYGNKTNCFVVTQDICVWMNKYRKGLYLTMVFLPFLI